jgi:hypothetical protein
VSQQATDYWSFLKKTSSSILLFGWGKAGMGARLEIITGRTPSNLPQILNNKSGGSFST